jgi:hypothetical protein
MASRSNQCISMLQVIGESPFSPSPRRERGRGDGFARCLKSFLSLLFSVAAVHAADPDKPLMTVLYTAESHAALLPCDCPLQPLGGVARRASLIERYRKRGPVIVVDAGGWAAGGIYDEGSDGDSHRDDLRSELMLKAMQAMSYDAVAFSPQDLAYHTESGVPGQMATAMPITIKDKLSLPVRVFGWEDSSATIIPNIKARQTGDLSAVHSDRFFDIHLSRLGEDGAEELAAATHGDLVINAGRKATQRIGWNFAETTIANFDYEAQRLGVVEVWPASAGSAQHYDLRVRFEPLGSDIPDDPKVIELLRPHLDALKKKGKEKIAVEFWTMPECPGCVEARPDMQRIAAELAGRVDIDVHFVLHHENGKLASLHGDREFQEARVQSVIRKYYPEKMWEWLAWREQARNAGWEEGAKKLGLLPARIRGALALGEAEELLKADYELMKRRRVDGTPALIVANRPLEATEEIRRMPVLRLLCANLAAPKPAVCKDVPACFFNAQCKKRGFIGVCKDAEKPAAVCDFSRPAVPIPALVIDDKENLFDNREHVQELMLADLPGLDYRVIDASDPEARGWIDKLKLAWLPAYIFDPIAKTEVGYADNAGKFLYEDTANNKLVVKPLLVGSHRLANRPRIKGRADLIVSRFSKNGQESLETALMYVKTLGPNAPELMVHDALYFKEPSAEKRAAGSKVELAASSGLAELEEAARAAAVKQIAPEKYEDYLIERGKARGSSYWDAPLNALHIDPAKVRALAENPSNEVWKELCAEAEFLKSIESGGDITFLAENCEVITMRSRDDLRHMLEAIGRNRGQKSESGKH